MLIMDRAIMAVGDLFPFPKSPLRAREELLDTLVKKTFTGSIPRTSSVCKRRKYLEGLKQALNENSGRSSFCPSLGPVFPKDRAKGDRPEPLILRRLRLGWGGNR